MTEVRIRSRLFIRVSKEENPERPALTRGALEMIVLRLLQECPDHGFGISRRLSEVSGEWLQLEEGTLYPCLYRMEQRGWVRSEVSVSDNNRRARYYSVTAEGRKELGRQVEFWRQFSGVVEDVLKRGGR